jgi:hypothetical protein
VTTETEKRQAEKNSREWENHKKEVNNICKQAEVESGERMTLEYGTKITFPERWCHWLNKDNLKDELLAIVEKDYKLNPSEPLI